MNETRDTNEAAATGDEDGELDPRQAATLLEQTTRRARRKFNPNPPLLSLLRAIVVLGAYGAVWLSVRGQHPYKGPAGWALAILYALVIIVIIASVGFLKRAKRGSRGHPGRGRRRSPSWRRRGSWCTCSWGRWSTPGPATRSSTGSTRPRHR